MKRFGKVIIVGLRVDFEVKILGKVILLVEIVDVVPVCKMLVEDSVTSKLNGDDVVEGVVSNCSVVVSIERSKDDDIKTSAPSVCISLLLSVVVTGIDPLVDSIIKRLDVVLEVSISDLGGTLDCDETDETDES